MGNLIGIAHGHGDPPPLKPSPATILARQENQPSQRARNSSSPDVAPNAPINGVFAPMLGLRQGWGSILSCFELVDGEVSLS